MLTRALAVAAAASLLSANAIAQALPKVNFKVIGLNGPTVASSIDEVPFWRQTLPKVSGGALTAAVTLCVMLATIMQALDTTIANVALPYMQGSLSASAEEINWVLTSSVIAAAIMTAPVGWMARRFGRKRLFLGCLTGFVCASMACGAAQTRGGHWQGVAWAVSQSSSAAVRVKRMPARFIGTVGNTEQFT